MDPKTAKDMKLDIYRIVLRYPKRHGSRIAKTWKYTTKQMFDRYFEYHKRYGVYPSLAPGEVEITGERMVDGTWQNVMTWTNP